MHPTSKHTIYEGNNDRAEGRNTQQHNSRGFQ